MLIAHSTARRTSMTGKADGPADVDRSTEHRGSSVATPGVTALDEEREASLADEGGSSGAVIESQEVETVRRRNSAWPVAHRQAAASRRPGPNLWFVAGALAAGAIGALALLKRR
jgi:hypothetical protein